MYLNYFGCGYYCLKMKYMFVYYIVFEKKIFNVFCDYYIDFQFYLILVFVFGYFIFIIEINFLILDIIKGFGMIKKFLIQYIYFFLNVFYI